jgi:hypothetical protein
MKHYLILYITTLFLFSCSEDVKKETKAIAKIESNISKEIEIELPSKFVKNIDKDLATNLNSDDSDDLFLKLVSNKQTGINFTNTIIEDDFKNHKSYPQIYNGGGVAVGDLNNDGLPDIYFAGNSVKDKIYFNTGNFTFKDVTKDSGISKNNSGWSFGVNMVDINADGYLDIYVCKAGPYNEKNILQNKLFINNGDGTFKEDAKAYGLNITNYSVQSTFFDYDKDGDLDMYLLNHPLPGIEKKLPKELKKRVELVTSGKFIIDNFFENVNGKFIVKTKDVGLLNYGYKNSVSVGDMNNDGYPDLYVCTDYGEPDLYYINNGDKTFTNVINEKMKHISYFSMGSDISDINNDGFLDVYVTDMTPSDHIKSKVFMATMDPKKFNAFVKYGYHYQYMLNTLQLNNNNFNFSEIAQLAGIAKTDWSWSPLFFDIDLDGKKDLFVTNGIKENLNDNDIKEKVYKKEREINHKLSLSEYLDVVPSTITPNQVFKNEGKLLFKDTSKKWIDNSNFNSNGAAYADLDGDGDLDLVLNNMDAKAAIYENKGGKGKVGNSISINIKGTKNNLFGIGTKISIPLENETIFYEHYTAKGYLSSVDYKIIIGLGSLQIIPKMIVEWPDGKVTNIINLEVNKEITISYDDLIKTEKFKTKLIPLLKKIEPSELGILYKHKEDEINDFKKQILLPYSESQNGPFIDVADVNNDGREDFFVGGAAGSAGELYLQLENGNFKKQENIIWENDKKYEDLGVLFFDYDNDGDQDLYITSGGAAFNVGNQLYQDRIYANNGKGEFSKTSSLPENYTSSQVVISNDIDGDGDLDLFVGGRIIPDKYPYSPNSQLLINDNGIFKDEISALAPSLKKAGLVTDAVFSDFDGDGDKDLIITSEWSPIQFFENKNGNFSPIVFDALNNSEGIWFSVKAIDIDNDGDEDYLLGNLGLNSKFNATVNKPFHVFCDDFDKNGTYDIVFSKDYKGKLVPMRGKQCSSEQMPFISKNFKNFISFAKADINDIIGEEKLSKALHYSVKNLKSICLINEGDKNFKKIDLPIEAQFSTINNFTVSDLDGDSKNEIIISGNLYSTEVETTRYDASIGTVLQYNNGAFSVLNSSNTGLGIDGDSKDAVIINLVNNKKLLIITNNNSKLETFIIN